MEHGLIFSLSPTPSLSLSLIQFHIHIVVEVASGEYGYEYIDKMIALVDNGRLIQWTPNSDNNIVPDNQLIESHAPDELYEDEEIDPRLLEPSSTAWDQFCVLFKRRTKQMWRDSV